MGKVKSVIIVGLLIFSGLIGFTMFKPDIITAGTTIYVGGTGPGNYTTIQAAIDNASSGDIIYIYNGTYFENIMINKTIELIGESRDYTIIDGCGANEVVNVSANWVNITGFTITNGSCGVYIYSSSYNNITNNNISLNDNHGIYLDSSPYNEILINNIFSNEYFGIYLDSSSNINITNNVITGETSHPFDWDGIHHESSSNNKITNNTIIGYGSGSNNKGRGIYFNSNSNNNCIINNNISKNSRGIYLDSSSNNNISGNNLSYNSLCGIGLIGSLNNNNISGNYISYNFDYGIMSQSSLNSNIIGNDFFANSKYSIYFYTGSSHNNRIINNNFLGAGTKFGRVHLEQTINTTVIGNTFYNGGGMYLLGTLLSNYNTHNITTNNIVNGKPIYYYKNCNDFNINGIPIGQLFIANCSNFDVRNLKINNTIVAIILAHSRNVNITNNEFTDCSRGISLITISDSIISSNNITENGYGVYIAGSSNSLIKCNIFTNNSQCIYFSSSSNIIVSENNISKGNDNGISVYSSQNNLFLGNIISFNDNHGISFAGFSTIGNKVAGNKIFSNSGNGLSFHLSTNNNFITTNIIVNNSRGISITSSDSNTIISNTITDNNYGLYLTNSPSNNLIYHNNIINNTNQALDGTSANSWDNGYPSGGNYWSDHSSTSPDLYSGATTPQTSGSPDGICDNQYNIGGSSIDYYPLKNYWITTPPSAPTGLNTNPGNREISLTWNPPLSDGGTSLIVGYKIYRGIKSGEVNFLTEVGKVLSYIDKGLTNGVIYYYNISAVNPIGEGPLSNEVSSKPIGPPYVPENFQVNSSGGSFVNLSWSPPSSDQGSPITNYVTYRSTEPGTNFIYQLIGNITYFNDTSVTNGITYYYKIRAMNLPGLSPPTNEVNATPAASPSPPTGFSATAGNFNIDLIWNPPVNDGGFEVTNYIIYRGLESGSLTLLTEIGNLLNYHDTDVINGATYFYQISARNIIGEGVLSNEVNATVHTIPSAPQDLTADAGDSYVNLIWKAPSSDGGSPVINYYIYKGMKLNDLSLLTVVKDIYYYNDTEVMNGFTYYYKVSALNAINESPYSNVTSATPLGRPSAPKIVIIDANDCELKLTWQAPDYDGGTPITNYRIYRSTSSGIEIFLIEVENIFTFIDSELINGITYYYKISARNIIGEGPLSEELFGIPVTIPSRPLDLHGKAGNYFVKLTWNAPFSDGGVPISNYIIYRGTGSNDIKYYKEIENLLHYNDTSVTNGVTYFYKVSAKNSIGEGHLSNEINATPKDPPTIPGTPKNLNVFIGNSYVKITWDEPDFNGNSQIINYKIYRSIVSNNEKFHAKIDNLRSFNDTATYNGITYYYKVSAVNAIGEGPLSEEVNATPGMVPFAPIDLDATAGDSYVNLTWNAITLAGNLPNTNYLIYKSTEPEGELLLIEIGDLLFYNDTTVTNNITYFYRVSARNIIGESPLSKEINCTPKITQNTPEEPQKSDDQNTIENNDTLLWIAVTISIIFILIFILVWFIFIRKKIKQPPSETSEPTINQTTQQQSSPFTPEDKNIENQDTLTQREQ